MVRKLPKSTGKTAQKSDGKKASAEPGSARKSSKASKSATAAPRKAVAAKASGVKKSNPSKSTGAKIAATNVKSATGASRNRAAGGSKKADAAGTAKCQTSSSTVARTRTSSAQAPDMKNNAQSVGKEASTTGRTKKKAMTTPRLPLRNNNHNGNGTYTNDAFPSEPPTPEQLRKVKTGLTKKDLKYFEELLLQKRVELVGDVESLQIDARNDNGGISYEHMADTGTDSYEQEFTLGLVESERKLLHEIDEALFRLRDGLYGVCLETGRPIARPRLEAKPWAKYCIEVARDRERRGLM